MGRGKYPCGMCGNEESRNLIRWLVCQKWIHKRCSDVDWETDMFKCSKSTGECTTDDVVDDRNIKPTLALKRYKIQCVKNTS